MPIRLRSTPADGMAVAMDIPATDIAVAGVVAVAIGATVAEASMVTGVEGATGIGSKAVVCLLGFLPRSLED